MNALSWIAITLCLIMVLVLAWRARRRSSRWRERASRPRELARADLVYAEKLFRIAQPIRLAARLDRAYRQPDGTLVLVELKTRRVDRPYLSDVIQLSAQKLAIEQQTEQAVAAHGFVTIERPGPRRSGSSHRVNLLTADAVIAVARRRDAILAGELSPKYANSRRACELCAFSRHCAGPQRFADDREQ